MATGIHPATRNNVSGSALIGRALANSGFKISNSDSPAAMLIARRDIIAVFAPNFLRVCEARTPAKNKSPKPKLINLMLAKTQDTFGTVGKVTITGKCKPDIALAAVIIGLPGIIQTMRMSMVVRAAAKMKTVFHVKRLLR